MTAGGKECELPTADSCAIMEGEDAEDELMDLTKKPFFAKMRSFSREVGTNFIPTHAELQTGRASCSECVFRGPRMALTQFHSSRLHRSIGERRTTQMMLNPEDKQMLQPKCRNLHILKLAQFQQMY